MPSRPASLSMLVAAWCCGPLLAQCVPPALNQSLTNVPFSMSTTFIPNPDPVFGANLFFDVIVDQPITIRGFAVNCMSNAPAGPDVRGQTGEIELWSTPGTAVGATTPGTGGTTPATPPGWTSRGRVQAVIQDVDLPTGGPLPTPVLLAPGSYGFAVNYLRIVSGQPNAGAPLLPLYTSPLAFPVPLTSGDDFLKVTAVGAQTSAWTSAPFTRIVNLQLDYTILPNSAFSTPYGDGCPNPFPTFYEEWNGPGTIDLSTAGFNGLTLFNQGPNYVVTLNTQPGLFVQPGSTLSALHVNTLAPARSAPPGWDNATSGPIALPFTFPHPGAAAGTNLIDVSSNGIVYLATATSTFGFYSSYQRFVNDPPALAAAWGDLHPADLYLFSGGVGDIWVDFDPLNQWVAVTWNGCQVWNEPTNLVTAQLVLFSGGSVAIRYGGPVSFSQAPFLVGYTPGNGTADPGSGPVPRQAPDLIPAAAGAGYASGTGAPAASLRLTTRPRVGRSLILQTTGALPTTVANLVVLSAGSLPGVDLSGLGLLGCRAWVTLPAVLTDFAAGPGPFSWNVTGGGTIPAAVAGFSLYGQAVQFDLSAPPRNPVGLLLSDALCIHFDVN